MRAFDRPRILKSHEYFDPRYPMVVYMVRDVRAVLVSYYHVQLRMHTIEPTVTLSEFAKKLLLGKADRYGTWRENVASWTRVRGQ
mgnify:FL=1